jgi:hypothetical protein
VSLGRLAAQGLVAIDQQRDQAPGDGGAIVLRDPGRRALDRGATATARQRRGVSFLRCERPRRRRQPARDRHDRRW